jgi:hypothetical protein
MEGEDFRKALACAEMTVVGMIIVPTPRHCEPKLVPAKAGSEAIHQPARRLRVDRFAGFAFWNDGATSMPL